MRLEEGLGPLRASRMELCLWAGDQNHLCPGMSKDMMGIKSVRRHPHQLEAQDLWALGSVTADYDRRLRASSDGRGTQCGGQHPGKTGLWKGSPGDTGRRGEAGAPPDLDIPACRASVFLLRSLRPGARQHCPRRPFPGLAGCSVDFLCLVFRSSHLQKPRKPSISVGARLLLFNLTKGSVRTPGPFLDGDLTGGRSPLRLRTPGADCWLSGVLVLLTRKYLYLPENPLRSVGKILDMIHVAGTLESRHFLCFSIYLSTHPLSIFHLLPLFPFFLPSIHPSIQSSIHLSTHPFVMPILDPEAKGGPLPPHCCHAAPPRKGASALLTPL